MQEIALTIFDRGEGAALIQPMLDEFERFYKIHVNLEIFGWGVGWSRLVECALYGKGPDLSEVGSTWVMDFVRMNAVSSLSPFEVTRLGSEKDFFSTNWHSCVAKKTVDDEPVVWAIPWTSDVRLAYYRRDLFGKIDLDLAHAFEHIDSLAEVIRSLKAKGVELPLALSTQLSHINLHHLASWLWDVGGDFLTTDGSQVAFNSQEALHGLRHYFQLGDHIPVAYHKIDDLEADRLFVSGEAAAVFSGWWLLVQSMAPNIRESTGVTAMPGSSFVGGTHLVPWKHSRKREQAFLLADFMVKRSAEYNIFPSYSLPAYIPSWERIQFIAQPHLSAVFDALQKGRSFPTGQLWGLVEKRLTDAIPVVWEKVFDRGGTDVEKILADTIVPLARRINITLE